jgi:putative transposase
LRRRYANGAHRRGAQLCAPTLIPVMFDRHKHHRRSIRLRGRDYSRAGMYFVTLCTYYRECLFGTVGAGGVRLSEWGRVARDEWLRTAQVRPGVVLDAFVIMPNHLHGIIILTPESQYAGTPVGAHGCAPLRTRPTRPIPGMRCRRVNAAL